MKNFAMSTITFHRKRFPVNLQLLLKIKIMESESQLFEIEEGKAHIDREGNSREKRA